ncbi:hypothetical protein GCM10027456_78810 [Kineosporia babensis]
MVWFLVDDGLGEHPKVLAIPRGIRVSAIGVWTMAGVWSSGQLTDGRISSALVIEKGGRSSQISALIAAGMWHDTDSPCPHSSNHCPGTPAPGELVFHDWFDWQRSRERILHDRERKASAGRAGGRASGASRREGSRSSREAHASSLVEPLVHHPDPNPQLIDLVCRRLFGNARHDVDVSEQAALWKAAAGQADLGTELRNFLIRNADTVLNDPPAALLGWLSRAAERAATATPKPILGCALCTVGWLPDDPETGMPRPCPTCKPHRYADRAGTL